MSRPWIYRVGLGQDEVSEDALKRSGLKYKKVSPREQFLASLRGVLGKPYRRGASVLKDAPEVFDCSSLIAWAAVEAGFAIPRIVIDQYVYSQRISREELVPGDLIFINSGLVLTKEGSHFSQVLGKEVPEVAIRTETLEYLPGTRVPGGVDHEGVYMGEGKVIHVSASVGCVREDDVEEKFKNIVGYGRIINGDDERFVVEIPESMPELRNKQNLASFLTQFML